MAKSMVLADLGRHLETAHITHSSKSSQLTAIEVNLAAPCLGFA